METPSTTTNHKLNTIWLSDIHLGYKSCRAQFVLDFLEHNRADTIYLVGDIVDLWALSRRFMWPDSHHAVLKKLIDLAASGIRVVYIPGNHDSKCRDLCNQQLLNIDICREVVHTTADGKRLLITHGDEFDHLVRGNHLYHLLGDLSYDLLLFLNRWGNRLRKCMGLPYWSLAYYIKNRVADARAAIRTFEEAAICEARLRGLDGIICGHIHQPEIRTIDGILYCNDGDWVESCTALVEKPDGHLQLTHWGDLQQTLTCSQAANDEQLRQYRSIPILRAVEKTV